MSKQSQTIGDLISYTPAVALPEGNHTVRVTIGVAPNSVSNSWGFKSATAPEISNQTPFYSTIAPGAAIEIKANYSDVGAGIAVAGVRLEVDQVNVTSQAIVTTSAIRYTKGGAYSNGEHTVRLTVRDLAGNETISTFAFSVGFAPLLEEPEPSDGSLIPFNTRPIIKAKYKTQGVPLDLATLRFYLDGDDVSTQSSITATNAQEGIITMQPAQALAPGGHAVYLEIANQGRTGKTEKIAR